MQCCNNRDVVFSSNKIIQAEVSSYENKKSVASPSAVVIKGEKGEKGYSPKIEVAEDTESVYKLKIINENADDSFTTPNLKGAGGQQEKLIAGDNIKIENNTISVLTTNNFNGDNTRPMTASGVQVLVGNIEVLLKTI